MRTSLTPMLLALAIVVSPATVLAQTSSPEGWHDHFRRANEYFAQAKYDKAISEYEAAYHIDAKPRILFNIGQAYRLKGDKQKAIEIYRRFLFKDPQGPGSSTARKLLVELERESQPPPPALPSPSPVPSAPLPPPTPPSLSQPVAATLLPPPANRPALDTEESPRPQPRRWGPTVLGIGGATLITGGAISLLLAEQKYSALGDMGCAPHCSQALLDGVSTRANVGYVLLSTGTVAATAGLLWWLLARR